MTFADHIFHNIYLLQEIFSHFQDNQRYCKIINGNIIAKKGQTKLLQLKAHFEKDLIFTKGAMDLAARNGHLNTVKWLHENRREGCSSYAVVWAACYGHLHVVQWLRVNRNIGSIAMMRAMCEAAKNGLLPIVRWLRENVNSCNVTCSRKAMRYATENGHYDIARWIQQNEKYIFHY